jgi:predicted nucleic acid-binding protein
MKLPDALRSIRQMAFDTAPLIYLVERNPTYFDRMFFIMGYVDRGLIDGVCSTIALAEVLVHPMRVGDIQLAKRYESVLSNSHSFRMESVTPRVARNAAGLRSRYNLQTPDALHVATALDAGCDAFLTNDNGIKRVVEITVLVLDELEIDPTSKV